MDISQLNPQKQEEAIRILAKHVTSERWEKIQEVASERTRYISLILEDIYQMHNAGAVVRSCEAFGIQDIHVVEKRNKFAIRDTTVAKGAHKWVDFHYHKKGESTITDCIKGLKAGGYRIVATTLEGDPKDPEEIPLDKPLAVAIGTEMAGLSKEAIAEADMAIKVPMYGFVQSYNLSVCAALILNALMKRVRASDEAWQLSDDEKRNLILKWLTKSIKHWAVYLEDL